MVDETGQPYPYTGDDPVNENDPTGMVAVGESSIRQPIVICPTKGATPSAPQLATALGVRPILALDVNGTLNRTPTPLPPGEGGGEGGKRHPNDVCEIAAQTRLGKYTITIYRCIDVVTKEVYAFTEYTEDTSDDNSFEPKPFLHLSAIPLVTKSLIPAALLDRLPSYDA